MLSKIIEDALNKQVTRRNLLLQLWAMQDAKVGYVIT